MNQEIWNTLFSWITGKQCMLPEGCNIPLEGILFYTGLLVLLIVAAYLERHQLVAMSWRK